MQNDSTSVVKKATPRFPDPHDRRVNGWQQRTAPPSPLRLKRSALPPTAQVWTIVGWLEGDCYIFNPTLAPGVTPDETTFAQLVADQLERDNGEAVIGTILVQCVTILKGKAVQS